MKRPQIKIHDEWWYVKGIDWYSTGDICSVCLDFKGEFVVIFNEAGSSFYSTFYEGSDLYYMDLENAEWDS